MLLCNFKSDNEFTDLTTFKHEQEFDATKRAHDVRALAFHCEGS